MMEVNGIQLNYLDCESLYYILKGRQKGYLQTNPGCSVCDHISLSTKFYFSCKSNHIKIPFAPRDSDFV